MKHAPVGVVTKRQCGMVHKGKEDATLGQKREVQWVHARRGSRRHQEAAWKKTEKVTKLEVNDGGKIKILTKTQ